MMIRTPTTRRCAIARTTQLTIPPDLRTTTTMSINQLDMEVALLARALAEVTDRRPRTTWEGETGRDGTAGPPKVTDVLSWLPGPAEMLFGRQDLKRCKVIAKVGPAYAQVTDYSNHVEVVVAADEPEVARSIGQSILDQVPLRPTHREPSSWRCGATGPTGLSSAGPPSPCRRGARSSATTRERPESGSLS